MTKTKQWIRGLAAAAVLQAVAAGPASAHAPDEYGHNTYVSITNEGLRIEMHLTPGPLVGDQLVSVIDTNDDDTLSAEEITHYGQRIASDLVVTVDNAPRPVTLLASSQPTTLEVRSGAAELVFTAIAAGPPPKARFSFQDNHAVLKGPAQASVLDEHNLPDDLVINRAVPRAVTVTGTFTQPTGTADSIASIGTSGTAATTSPSASSSTSTKRTKRLQRILGASNSIGAVAAALGVATLLGALHALTPGHGKTIAGAYLIGEKATIRHAVILGLSTTITHTASVLILGGVAIGLTGRVDPGSLTNALRWISGALVLGIGLTLLIRRIRNSTAGHGHAQDGHSHTGHIHGGAHTHAHDAHADDAHDHPHDHGGVAPDAVGVRRLVALGATGGVIPCPEALGVMIVAVSIHRQVFGMAMIIAFSLGLASILVAVGIALVRAKSIINQFAKLPDSVTNRWLPIFSAAVVSLLGLAILSGHVV